MICSKTFFQTIKLCEILKTLKEVIHFSLFNVIDNEVQIIMW